MFGRTNVHETLGPSIGTGRETIRREPADIRALSAHGGTAQVARTPWGSLRWTVRLPRALRGVASQGEGHPAHAGAGEEVPA